MVPTTARPSSRCRRRGHRRATSPGSAPEQPVIAMTGTGQPDSTGTTSTHTPPSAAGPTTAAHQRQARTARVRGGGEPHERRGQRCPRRTATTESTATPDTRSRDAGRHAGIAKNSSNNSHTDKHESTGDRGERPSAAAQAARAGDRPADPRAKRPAGSVHGPRRRKHPRRRGPARARAAPQPAPAPQDVAASGSRPDPSGCGAPSVVVAFVLSLFAARLIQLQGIDENDYAAIAVAKGAKTITLEAPRAPIYDRNGVALAQSVDAAKLVADPTYTTRVRDRDRDRSCTTGSTSTTSRRVTMLRKTWHPLRRARPPPRAGAAPQSIVDASQASRAARGLRRQGHPADLPGRRRRRQPVGFVDAENHGSAGFESSLDARCCRRRTARRPSRWPAGSSFRSPTARSSQPEEGTGVRLTIDRTSSSSPSAGWPRPSARPAARRGTAVVMDVQTGQILALADYPTFDPNKLRAVLAGRRTASRGTAGRLRAGQRREGADLRRAARRRLRHAAYEDHGPAGPAERRRRRSTTTSATATLRLTATGVVAKSSNIGTVLAARQMPTSELLPLPARLRPRASATDVGLDGESRRPAAAGRELAADQPATTIAFGQGLSASTPCRWRRPSPRSPTAASTSQPSLVDGYVDARRRRHARRPAGPSTASSATRQRTQVARMMEAVTGQDGTAPDRDINGYRVAGKTGTAQRVDPSCGCYDGSFTCRSRASRPPTTRGSWSTSSSRSPRTATAVASTGGPVFHDLMAAPCRSSVSRRPATATARLPGRVVTRTVDSLDPVSATDEVG